MRAKGDWRCPLPTAALHLASLLLDHIDSLLEVGLLKALHADLVDAHAPAEADCFFSRRRIFEAF